MDNADQLMVWHYILLLGL